MAVDTGWSDPKDWTWLLAAAPEGPVAAGGAGPVDVLVAEASAALLARAALAASNFFSRSDTLLVE